MSHRASLEITITPPHSLKSKQQESLLSITKLPEMDFFDCILFFYSRYLDVSFRLTSQAHVPTQRKRRTQLD